MFFTNLFDLLIAQHATSMRCFVFVLLCVQSLTASMFIMFCFLLDLESGLSSPVLSKRFGGRIVVFQALRTFIRLSLLELIAICKGLLPLFPVLATSEATYALHFTY
jgi:hypothetical protein